MWLLAPFFFFFLNPYPKIIFPLIFRDHGKEWRGGGRGREERETSVDTCPHWGTGYEHQTCNLTLWCTGLCSNHWAMPARGLLALFHYRIKRELLWFPSFLLTPFLSFNFLQILYFCLEKIRLGVGAVCYTEPRKPWQLKRKNMDSVKKFITTVIKINLFLWPLK